MTIGGSVEMGALINATDAVDREVRKYLVSKSNKWLIIFVAVGSCPCPGATGVMMEVATPESKQSME